MPERDLWITFKTKTNFFSDPSYRITKFGLRHEMSERRSEDGVVKFGRRNQLTVKLDFPFP